MNGIAFLPTLGSERGPIIERFLRDRASVWVQIGQDRVLDDLIRQMLWTSGISFACYGAVIGWSQSVLQALAAAIKLPLLFLLTLAICLPALYVYNLLCGGRLGARQLLGLALAAITVTAVFTLAFAPITLFFLLSAPNYQFFVLLNVAILTLTGGIGLSFLVDGARKLNALHAADDEAGGRHGSAISLVLLPLWLLLYAFVGAQLGWALRPFVGLPGDAWTLLRPYEGNFYSSVIDSLSWLLR
jgi:hypothetical protein